MHSFFYFLLPSPNSYYPFLLFLHVFHIFPFSLFFPLFLSILYSSLPFLLSLPLTFLQLTITTLSLFSFIVPISLPFLSSALSPTLPPLPPRPRVCQLLKAAKNCQIRQTRGGEAPYLAEAFAFWSDSQGRPPLKEDGCGEARKNKASRGAFNSSEVERMAVFVAVIVAVFGATCGWSHFF